MTGEEQDIVPAAAARNKSFLAARRASDSSRRADDVASSPSARRSVQGSVRSDPREWFVVATSHPKIQYELLLTVGEAPHGQTYSSATSNQ